MFFSSFLNNSAGIPCGKREIVENSTPNFKLKIRNILRNLIYSGADSKEEAFVCPQLIVFDEILSDIP
jgi:hypothetical protein